MNNLLRSFGIAYLINLPDRVDRLKTAKKQFERVNWPVRTGGVEVFSALRYHDSAGFPSAAVRGCFESHLHCLKLASEKGSDSVLIMEDDIALSGCLKREMPSVERVLNECDWDFVYFGHYETGDIAVATRDTNPDEVVLERWRGDLLTTHFYAVNGRILPRLIAHLDAVSRGIPGDQEHGPMPVDGAYNIFRRKNPQVQCYIAKPRLGWQMPSRSDITPNPLDEIRYLRPLTALLRKVKQKASLRKA